MCGGVFTQTALGSFTRTGGTVNLTGTLNNAGGTLLLTDATGSWRLALAKGRRRGKPNPTQPDSARPNRPVPPRRLA